MIKSIAKHYNVTTTVLFTLYIVALFTTGAKYCHTFTVNLQLCSPGFETYQYYSCLSMLVFHTCFPPSSFVSLLFFIPFPSPPWFSPPLSRVFVQDVSSTCFSHSFSPSLPLSFFSFFASCFHNDLSFYPPPFALFISFADP